MKTWPADGLWHVVSVSDQHANLERRTGGRLEAARLHIEELNEAVEAGEWEQYDNSLPELPPLAAQYTRLLGEVERMAHVREER